MAIKLIPHKEGTKGLGAGVIIYSEGDITWMKGEKKNNAPTKEGDSTGVKL